MISAVLFNHTNVGTFDRPDTKLKIEGGHVEAGRYRQPMVLTAFLDHLRQTDKNLCHVWVETVDGKRHQVYDFSTKVVNSELLTTLTIPKEQ